MQITSKVIRLDLNYASENSHLYQKQSCYIAPYRTELAEHFARRLLAYLLLIERSPQWAKTEGLGKTPDLYVTDASDHIQLWCNVDVLSEKQMQRASHQADLVLLFLDDTEQKHIKSQYKHFFNNVQFHLISHQQLLDFCDMLKGHMQLNVWRQDNQLLITDGEQSLEFSLTPPLELRH